MTGDCFEQLVDAAWHHEFSGWDFSYITGRMREEPLSWDYRQFVLAKIKSADSLLDMDTGGGEFLSSLQPLPPHTGATEGYAPNIPIARARLEPLGVRVVAANSEARLPFDDNAFDLVVNRHGSFLASEIYRILKPGRSFITQQVGGKNCIGLNELLQERVDYEFADWTSERAAAQLEAVGLQIIDRREEFPPVEFADIGAVVYYLKAIPWQVRDFTVEKYYDRLKKIHALIQARGSLKVTAHRFYIEAHKS